MSNKFLNVKFGADTTNFKKGTNEVRAELTELNSAMRTNKREQKELNDEIKKLEKEQKNLKTVMSQVKTPTKEMTDEADRLQKALDQAALKAAKLKTEEQELGGKISATKKELNEQSAAAEKNAITMEQVGNAMKKAATLTATGMAALFTYTSKMAASADDINTIAKQTGLATDEIQKFMYASELIDVSLDTLTGSMSRLIRNMNTAATTGSGTAYDAFMALDVAITDASGTLRNNQDVFNEIIDKLAKIEDETQRDAYAMSVFGKSAQELNPLIMGGTQQLKEFGDELEREGLILDQMQLDKLNEFNDKIDTFKATFQAKMMESSVDWIDAFDDLLEKSDEIVELVATLISGFAKVTGYVVDHKEAVLALVIAYGSLKAVMKVNSLISSVTTTVKTLTVATTNATAAQVAFNTAIKAAPYIALAAGVVKLISKISSYRDSAEEASSETQKMNSVVDDLNKSIEDAVNSAQGEINLLKIKADRYEELRKKASLTADEERELYNLATEFESKYPNEIRLIDNKTNSYKAMGKQLDELSEKMLANARISGTQEALSQAYIEKTNKEKELTSASENLNSVYKTDVKDYREFGDSTIELLIPGLPYNSRAMKRYAKAVNEAEDAKEKLKKEYQEIIDSIEKYEKELKDAFGSGDEIDEIENFADIIEKLDEKYTFLIDTEKEYNNTQKLSVETLNSIISMYPSLQGVVNDYLAGLVSGEDVINRLQLAYDMDVKNYEASVKEKISRSQSFYREIKELNDSYINTLADKYGIDLSNYKTYAEAKLAIENAFLTAKAKNWAKYYDIESGTYKISSRDLMQYKKELMASGMNSKEANAYIAEYKQDYWNTVNAVNEWNSLGGKLDTSVYDAFNQYTPTYSNSSSGSSNSSSTSKKEVSVYEQAQASFAKLVNDRIAEIEELTKAEVSGADERIAAIESEIEAREKLADTEDIQKRIDFIKARLKYSMLDDFERAELEKQLADIEKEQTDKLWKEGKQAEINAIEAEKSAIEASNQALIDELNERLSYANTLFTDLNNGYQAATTIANNNSKTANITIVEKALTTGQVTQIVKDALGIGEVF